MRHKPGDLLTMKVLAVEPGLMRVEFDGRQFEIEMPIKPMRHSCYSAEYCFVDVGLGAVQTLSNLIDRHDLIMVSNDTPSLSVGRFMG
jgi:hypothetical protein